MFCAAVGLYSSLESYSAKGITPSEPYGPHTKATYSAV